MADSGWSQQEIEASVDVYIEILNKEIAGEPYNKAAVNRQLRENILASRSRSSVEMRMCNISAVLNDQDKQYIQGYKPRENVSPNVYPMIESALSRHSDKPMTANKSRVRISLPDSIPASFLYRAISRIDENGIYPYSESTTYDVVVGAKKYPPLAVVAFAYEEMTGERIDPGQIRGGKDTQAFKILAHAGLKPKAKHSEPKSDDQGFGDRADEKRKSEPANSSPKENKKPTVLNAKQPISDSDIIRIKSLLSSYSEITDARKPGDSKRAGRFRSGWKDATERNKDEYSQSTLSKITWQNLGYRLGSELGPHNDQWINAAYEHIAASWDANYFAPTSDFDLLDKKADEYEDLIDDSSESYEGNNTPPTRSEGPTYSYTRDARVKGIVRRQAKGICELCKEPAPFNRSNGKPYLEVHHVVPLKDGGFDKTTNAVAICPNCHMRCHHSVDAHKATEDLYRQVKRLVRPG